MTSRREFIRSSGLAVGAVAVGTAWMSGARGASMAAGDRPLPLYAVVFDDRFPDSDACAARARSLGERVVSLDRGDVTRLWYDDLYHRWRQGPAAIAGLTTADALLVLETFGNDAGLRLRFRAEHRLQGSCVSHRVHGSNAMLGSASRLELSGAQWSSHLGEVISRPRDVHAPRTEARFSTDLGMIGRGERGMLVSWVLAPRTVAVSA